MAVNKRSAGGFKTPFRFAHEGSRIVANAGKHYLDGAPLDLVQKLSVVNDDPEQGTLFVGVAENFFVGPSFSATANAAPYQLIGTAATLVPQANTTVLGGIIRVASQNVDEAVGVLKLQGGALRYSTSKDAWFTSRVAIDNVATGEAIVGLALHSYGGTDLATLPTDGLFFLKTEAATVWTFHARNGGASTTVADTTTIVADTFMELSFRVTDGSVDVFVNGTRIGGVATGDANLPSTSTDLLTVFIGRQAEGANVRYIDIDNFLVAQER